MFPIIFTLGVDGLGKLTSQGSSLLVMGIVGGAIVPVIQGAFADAIGIHTAFFIPVLCYLYVVFYGLRGSKHDLTPEVRPSPVEA
jgi:MFS transporter, FHS family, L-fucose permease